MSETSINQRLNSIFNELKRTRHVYSQSDFARQLGLSKATVNQMLLGQASITRRTVDKICDLYPIVNEVWLLTGSGDMFVDKQTQQPLASVQISNVGNSTTNVTKEADTAQEIAALKAENARLKEEIDWLRSLINPNK